MIERQKRKARKKWGKVVVERDGKGTGGGPDEGRKKKQEKVDEEEIRRITITSDEKLFQKLK